jgi:hypothetical protein
MSGWRRALVVGAISLSFIIVFLGLVLSHSITTNPGADRPEQCELLATTTDAHASILETQNTWSNFGYLIAGALIIFRSRNLLGAAVGLNLALEFLFSGLYHSKLTEMLQTIDVAWIYVLLLGLIAYAIQCLLFSQWAMQSGYLSLNAPLFVAAGIAIVTVVVGVFMGIHKNDIFESTTTTFVLVGLLFILLLIGFIAAGIRGADAMSIIMPIALIIAIGVPVLFFKFSDGPKHHIFNWCCPKAVMQAHAAWHMLSAVLLLVAYDFFANFCGDGRIFSFARPAQEFPTIVED